MHQNFMRKLNLFSSSTDLITKLFDETMQKIISFIIKLVFDWLTLINQNISQKKREHLTFLRYLVHNRAISDENISNI